MLQNTAKLLVLARTFLSAVATLKLNYTRQLRFETYNPNLVQIGSHIFVVSKYDSFVRIDSSDENYQSCTIHTDSEEEKIDPARYEAIALGQKKIIVWGFHKSMFEQNEWKGYRKYVILLIDIQKCSYLSLKDHEEKVPKDYPLLLPEIVVHQDDTYDVFFFNKSGCLPCRFNDEGVRIQNDHQIQNRPWSLRIKKLEPTETYVVVENKTVMKILDRDFNELKRVNSDKYSFIDEFSISPSPESTQIGLITRFNMSDIILSLFDSSLKLTFTKFIYKSDYEKYYTGSNYHVIDSKGRTLITFESAAVLEKIVKHSMLIVDAKGQLVSEFDFDVFQSECDHSWIYRPAFLLDDWEYCTVNHYIPKGGYGYSKIKCFDVSQL